MTIKSIRKDSDTHYVFFTARKFFTVEVYDYKDDLSDIEVLMVASSTHKLYWRRSGYIKDLRIAIDFRTKYTMSDGRTMDGCDLPLHLVNEGSLQLDKLL